MKRSGNVRIFLVSITWGNMGRRIGIGLCLLLEMRMFTILTIVIAKEDH